jgi:hypothetical protein
MNQTYNKNYVIMKILSTSVFSLSEHETERNVHCPDFSTAVPWPEIFSVP